jgi:peptidoglycan-N-acetylglucosamine deacetylase
MTRLAPSRRYAFTLVPSLAAVAAALAGCPDSTEAEPACTDVQALSAQEIRGGSMAPKTLALTFDDGPGPRTGELSTYLKAEGIQAGFFVNGRQLLNGTATLAQLVADGHVVANHTENHPSLTAGFGGTRPDDPTVIAELEQTDVKIAPFVTNERLLFRPPFGHYDATTHATLEPTAMNKYVGPIGWDIGEQMGPAQAADWDCWVKENDSDGVQLTTEACGELYLQEIEAKGKGIVLLHDPYGWAEGNTVDMVKYLVPKLKAEGFAFQRVDLVPAIDALLPPLPPEDAGNDAASSSSGGGSSSGTSGTSGTSGGKPDPCPPSPQPESTNIGESGNLRGR